MRIPLLFALLGASVASEAGAQPARPAPADRAAFVARCLQDSAADPTNASALESESCEAIWRNAQSGLPIADALLGLASYDEEANLARARAVFPRMTWRRPPAEVLNVMTDALLAGRLGTREIILYGQDGIITKLSFQANAPRRATAGDRANADWLDALVVRGASVDRFGCAQFPAEDFESDGPFEMAAIGIEPAEGSPLFVLEQISSLGPTETVTHSFELVGVIPRLSELQSGHVEVIGAEGSRELWAACDE